MTDLLQLLPIYLFMLIPVWIPLIAMTIGGLRDAISAPARRVAAQPRAGHAARKVSPAGPRVPAAGTAA
ncbi:MAG: hypothetical protein NTX33_02680 [Propionibacteriales bacterium]|nr:hypothetical protein [Propionibacteriales bacterium]